MNGTAPDPAVAEIVRRWLYKGDNDMAAAAKLLEGPPDTACYHCEQAAEKYMKALLTFHGIAAPITHDIGYYQRKLPYEHRPAMADDDLDYLSTYGIDAWWEPDRAQAERALAIVRELREKVRAALPPAIAA